MVIDLNCDLGESFGAWEMGNDEGILQHITSANIACGFHAGDPVVMRNTVAAALRNKVALGAHPGFPDLQGFGRRNMQLSPEEVYAMVIYQIGALAAMAHAAGAKLHHVKPHGALYNMAAKDRVLADAIAQAVSDTDNRLILYGLSGSALIDAGKAAGLSTCSEVFADRTYRADGSLTPRGQVNALIDDTDTAVKQALQMVQHQTVTSTDGRTVTLQAETICLHGDGPHALEFARALYNVLQGAGISLQAPTPLRR